MVLSPFLFAVMTDGVTVEGRQESPWTVMFSDDIVRSPYGLETREEEETASGAPGQEKTGEEQRGDEDMHLVNVTKEKTGSDGRRMIDHFKSDNTK